jgi:hypothetical protein
MPTTHFSTLDGNFPYRCPSSENATGTSGCPPPPIKPAPPKKSDCTDKQAGSIIECQNQILGEALDVTGTPFSLHYQSDRVPGRKADNTVEIPLSGTTVSQELTHIDLQVLVAGQKFVQSFPAAPNQRTTFTWDGKDAYHRTVQGEQPVTVTSPISIARVMWLQVRVEAGSQASYQASVVLLLERFGMTRARSSMYPRRTRPPSAPGTPRLWAWAGGVCTCTMPTIQ